MSDRMCLRKQQVEDTGRVERKKAPAGAFLISALGAECAETLVEALDTTAGVHNLLGAGVERMALGANVQTQVTTHGGLDLDHVAAGTGSSDLFVLRMDIFFHWAQPCEKLCTATKTATTERGSHSGTAHW